MLWWPMQCSVFSLGFPHLVSTHLCQAGSSRTSSPRAVGGRKTCIIRSDSTDSSDTTALKDGSSARPRPALLRSSSAGDLQTIVPFVSPRGEKLSSHERFNFIASGLIPTRSASADGPLRNGKEKTDSSCTAIVSHSAFKRTGSTAALSPASPQEQRTSSTEPVRNVTVCSLR